jgi:DNA-binding LacI/PurR family transcriptional regulator
MNSVPAFTLVGREPAFRQIEGVLRSAIDSGELSCGSRLPTLQDFAARYRTSVFTIQRALDALERDGLIERVRRRGTFVISHSAKLRRVGIYFGMDFVHGRGMEVYRELSRQLSDELDSREVKHRLWVEGRSEGERGEPLAELAAAVAKREIQALIIGVTDPLELAWLQKLGLPLALLGTASVPYKVGINHGPDVDLAFTEFKRLGCRRIGAIFPVSATTHGPYETEAPLHHERFMEAFTDRLADAHLETRNSWVRVPDRLLPAGDHEEYGYRQFHEIWQQPERPDGLLVLPDTIVRGCVTAILESGVSVPGDLKLVLHRNEGVPVLCPLPAAWIVTDVGQIAAALIGQVERQLASQSVEPVLLASTFEKSGI